MAREKLKTLSEQMFYVLLVLTSELYGSEIVSEVSKLTNKRILLGPGTLYTILGQFVEEKIIIETKKEGRKRCYCITETGKDLLANEITRLNQMLIDTNTYSNKSHEN